MLVPKPTNRKLICVVNFALDRQPSRNYVYKKGPHFCLYYFAVYWVWSSRIFVAFEICVISNESFLMVCVFMEGCLVLHSDYEKGPNMY